MPADSVHINLEETLQAFLSERPPWVVRWGTLLFFAITVLVFILTWFVRYPDSVRARGVLVANNPPHLLEVKSPGRLERLLKADGEHVQQGDLLLVLQTLADHQTILQLERLADSLYVYVNSMQRDRLKQIYLRMQALDSEGHVGELQQDHQSIMSAFQAYTQYLGQGYYPRRRNMMLQDLQYIAAQRTVQEAQLELTQKDVALAAENFRVQEKLANQKVIAGVEYRNEHSKWLGKQLQIPQLQAALLANGAQQNEKRKEIEALSNEINLQKLIFLESLQQWRAALANWKKQYLINAPCSGVLVYGDFLTEGALLQTGQILGSVQPLETGYYVIVNLPHENFGKLSNGQKALLRFSAYPSGEFGTVDALLQTVKTQPTDSGYAGKLVLPRGLKTNRDMQLVYKYGMKTEAEIFTDNRRLLQRLLEGVLKAIE